MTSSVRIAIPLPTLARPDYNASGWAQYAHAVERFGAEAVAVPLDSTPGEIAHLVDRCQGVLLPGSPADVNPARLVIRWRQKPRIQMMPGKMRIEF